MKLKKFLYKISCGFSPLRFNLVINIINECNRKCSFCPYHSPILADNYHTNWVKAQRSMIDSGKLIRFIYKMRLVVKTISITGKGEPFMYGGLEHLCDTLNQFKIPFTITTNGYDMPQAIIYLNNFEYLKQIRVSLYDKKSNELLKYNHPKLSFFNMTNKPIKGIEDGYVSAQYGIEHERAIKDFNKTNFCKTPFSFLTVNTDGSIVPCYSFDETAHINDSFWKIWNGKKIREYRKQAVNGRNMEFADCDNCGVNIQ